MLPRLPPNGSPRTAQSADDPVLTEPRETTGTVVRILDLAQPRAPLAPPPVAERLHA